MCDRSTVDDKLSRLAWHAALAITLLVVIAFSVFGFRIRVDVRADMIAVISGYVFVTVYYRFVRQSPEIARALITFGQLVVVIVMGVMLSYAASAVPLPYRDAELHSIDRWLGFEREAYIAFLRQNDRLREVLSFAYATLMPQNVLVVIVALVARRFDRLQAYVVAFAIAVIATAATAAFIPAANAVIYVDKVPTDLSTFANGAHSYFPTLQGLRSGNLRIIEFGGLEGLISFPSFHTADGILLVWALWPMRLFRVPLLLLNLLLIASTPLCGAHYVTDIAGGAAVALGAMVATNWLMRMRVGGERCTTGEPKPALVMR